MASLRRLIKSKNRKDLRDEDDAFKLPLISIERTGIVKDPERKGSFQAHYYSDDKNGRSGRFVIAKKIVPDKTRNFAVASGTRTNNDGKKQKDIFRVNKKVVIQTISIPIPVYVNVEYKISIKTNYQQQMNTLRFCSPLWKNWSNQCTITKKKRPLIRGVHRSELYTQQQRRHIGRRH